MKMRPMLSLTNIKKVKLPNFLADFIVFKQNIFKLTKTDFLNAKVLKTFIGGSEVFAL